MRHFRHRPALASLSVFLLMLLAWESVDAQRIGIFNEKHKVIFKYKAGSTIDFRLDYHVLYPEASGPMVEARVYAVIDSIEETRLYMSEVEHFLGITGSGYEELWEPKQFESLRLDFSEVKSVSFTPVGQSVGTALMAVGIAAILISPLFGLNPGGEYSTDRLAIVAGMGAGAAVIGTTMYIAFGQKPVKLKKFDGVDYFKSYQPGSFSIIE